MVLTRIYTNVITFLFNGQINSWWSYPKPKILKLAMAPRPSSSLQVPSWMPVPDSFKKVGCYLKNTIRYLAYVNELGDDYCSHFIIVGKKSACESSTKATSKMRKAQMSLSCVQVVASIVTSGQPNIFQK